MSDFRFEEVDKEFECDGSLRDLYIFDTTIEDWNVVVSILTSYRYEYFVEGNPDGLPRPLTPELFENPYRSRVLKTYYHGLQINCHFFCEELFEVDIDPREVSDQGSLNHLFTFMRLLGDRTNKKVILTPENAEQIIIFSYSPKTNTLEYHPSAGFAG